MTPYDRCWTCRDKNPLPPSRVSMIADVLKTMTVYYQSDRTDFPVSEIVLVAWAKHPRAFGLPGYEDQYPNSQAVVLALVNGVAQGRVTRTSPGRYAAGG